jgi:predicted Zn-dependent protease
MTGVCRFHDLMLGRLLQLAGPDATIVLVSDRGVHRDQLRLKSKAPFPLEAPILMHCSHGILCMAGPGIRRDELVYGVRPVDVTPTILSLFGVPSGKDMQGRVLSEAFETPPQVEPIPSWEEVPGDCGRHAEQNVENTRDFAYALQQLAELGYVDKPSPKTQELLRMVRHTYDFNLAWVYMAARRPADALPLFERLVQEIPGEAAFQLHCAQCYYELGRREECRATVESVLQRDQNLPAAGLILANLCLAEGKTEEGLQRLLQAEKCSRPDPEIRYLIGRVYLRERRFEEAARTFQSVLNLDPDHAGAMSGLAQALLEQNEMEKAAEAALDAIRSQFDLPEAHYTLGVALAKTGRIARAIQAFDTCLALEPAAVQAHQWLAALHEQFTKDIAKAAHHRAMAEQSVPSHA